MISSHGRWLSIRTRLRSRSQPVALIIGFVVTVAGAWAWYKAWLGPIGGSLSIGVGSSILAAAIVAYLSPVNEAGYRKFISLGIDDVWSSRQAIDSRDWVDWVDRAREACILLGIAHGNWCGDDRFLPRLRDRLAHGVTFKMLFLHPESSSASIRAKEEKKGRNTQDAIRKSIGVMWAFREDLEPSLKVQLRLFVYDATPSCGLTWIDQFMIVTHYLAGLPNLTSPALLVKRPQVGMERSLYDIYADNLEKIERMSTELDERNIKDFLIQPQQEKKEE